MNTGETKPEIICVAHRGLIPTGHTYKPFKGGNFDDCQKEFQKYMAGPKRNPNFVPQRVYWVGPLHEMWVEMTYGTEGQ